MVVLTTAVGAQDGVWGGHSRRSRQKEGMGMTPSRLRWVGEVPGVKTAVHTRPLEAPPFSPGLLVPSLWRRLGRTYRKARTVGGQGTAWDVHFLPGHSKKLLCGA